MTKLTVYCREEWEPTGQRRNHQQQNQSQALLSFSHLLHSIAQLQDLSEKFRLVQLLSLPSHSPNAASGIDVSDYDFGPWLLDLLPPMRPLVWSLVLKIFARFSEKDACEREFDAALRSAHLLPVDTLKQIEVSV